MALQNYSEQHVFHMMSRITMLILKKLAKSAGLQYPGKILKKTIKIKK